MDCNVLLNKIYIISWFGQRTDPTLRNKRKELHLKQIEWCRSHDLEIIVYAQDYDDEDYVDDVTYIKHTGDVIPPGHARNKLLEHYYQTNDDFAVFADNDCVLYELPQHKDSIDFIERLRKLDMKDFDAVGIITPLNPARTAFSQDIGKASYDENYTFRRYARVGGGLLFIKNLQKHANEKLYFDEVNFGYVDDELVPGEDSDFAYTLWKAGHGTYATNHAIMQEYGRKSSTWIADDSKRYDRYIDVFVPMMNEKHGQILMLGVGSGDLDKGYSYYGVSTHVNSGTRVRFARDAKDRTKVLTYHGHTGIEFHPLPEPMQISEMIPILETSDLYQTNAAFKAGVDRMTGKVAKSGRGHSPKLKTFTNWSVLDPNNLPEKIVIPKETG
jgi:hypothetical protein